MTSAPGYKNATASEREQIAKDYENHIRNKVLSRENKSKDKEMSNTEKDLGEGWSTAN